MPSASSYTNKLRFSASVKNTKAQLPGGVGNLTQGSIAGCGLDVDYSPIQYLQVCGCNKDRPRIPPPLPPAPAYDNGDELAPPPAPLLPELSPLLFPPSYITVNLGSTDFTNDNYEDAIIMFPTTKKLFVTVVGGFNNNYIFTVRIMSIGMIPITFTSNGIMDLNWTFDRSRNNLVIHDTRTPPFDSNSLVSNGSPTILCFTFAAPIDNLELIQFFAPE
jgi:hypothetical protein